MTTEIRQPPSIDPTVLTTSQLHREVATLRELVGAEIQHLRELTDTKLLGIDARFEDLRERTAEQKEDTRKAVEAAFAAAKEVVRQQTEASERAITKSETAMLKQFDTIMTLVDANKQASDEKTAEVISRLDRTEAAAMGGHGAMTEHRDSNAANRAWMAFGMTSVLFLITLAGFAISLAK